MNEEDYIELNTLLVKLRVVCLKNMAKIDNDTRHLTQTDTARLRRYRRERERGKKMEKITNFKISSKTKVNSLAGAIAETMKEHSNETISLQAIGAGATNQAVKAIAVARGFLAPTGINIICIPAFTDVNVENEIRSGIKFIVKEEK